MAASQDNSNLGNRSNIQFLIRNAMVTFVPPDGDMYIGVDKRSIVEQNSMIKKMILKNSSVSSQK